MLKARKGRRICCRKAGKHKGNGEKKREIAPNEDQARSSVKFGRFAPFAGNPVWVNGAKAQSDCSPSKYSQKDVHEWAAAKC
jgi:hypothetical protein